MSVKYNLFKLKIWFFLLQILKFNLVSIASGFFWFLALNNLTPKYISHSPSVKYYRRIQFSPFFPSLQTREGKRLVGLNFFLTRLIYVLRGKTGGKNQQSHLLYLLSYHHFLSGCHLENCLSLLSSLRNSVLCCVTFIIFSY